jgi:hypothetical protein
LRYCVSLYTTELLRGKGLRQLALSIVPLVLGACAQVHTLENTAHLTRSELLRICEDLRIRAEQDCQWNVEEQQSSLGNRQTWEINCMARRDSARESFENVCHPSRFGRPNEPAGE